jgi:hypothetical protein
MKFYKEQGMTKLVKWRVYNGNIGEIHPPHLFVPTYEDFSRTRNIEM